MAYVFVEVDKTLGSTHSGSSSSTRTTTSSVDLRNWVKNVLIIGDPVAVLDSGDPDFLPTLAQMYQEGDSDVVESLTVWYPELKPVVENYIASNGAAASTTTNSGSSSSHSGSTTTTSSGSSSSGSSSTTTSSHSGSIHSGSSSSHSGSSGTASTPGTHTQSSSVTTSSTGTDHTGAPANTSSGSGHSGSSSSSSSQLDNLQNEYDEEAMRIYQEAMKESNNTSAAIDETPANYNTAQLERKQANYWPYILGGVAAVGLIYLLSRKKKNDKK